MSLDVWDFDLSLSLISVLFFDLLWGLLMDLHEIVRLTDRLFPLSYRCQLLLDLTSCFFHEVRLIAVVPHGPELSFNHLIYCMLPKIVCICFVRLFYFILFIYLFFNWNQIVG
jgi:hypothetical protein